LWIVEKIDRQLLRISQCNQMVAPGMEVRQTDNEVTMSALDELVGILKCLGKQRMIEVDAGLRRVAFPGLDARRRPRGELPKLIVGEVAHEVVVTSVVRNRVCQS
jgi:hypothetical protein